MPDSTRDETAALVKKQASDKSAEELHEAYMEYRRKGESPMDAWQSVLHDVKRH